MGSTLDHRNRMFLLLWLTLLCTVRRNNAVKEETQELSAEAGLCVVIPCSFTSDHGLTLKSAAWYKCEQNCTHLNIILNNNGDMIQPGFKGRVSPLELDLSQGDCSIIINDLRKSDSGLYQLGVMTRPTEEFTYRVNITVRDLTQKPTVMVPLLTEGQQTTLSCTAPGHCSGSKPNITWTWKQSGGKHASIPGNITNERQRSNLTFDPLAAHHGMEVTCKVSFTNEATTEETIALNVNYVREPKITGKKDVTVGDSLNLTCSVDSFPPSVITWTEPGSDTNLGSNTGSAILFISEVTSNRSGRYICTAKHLNSTQKKDVNVRVGLFSKILNSSGCKNHSKFLTCTCISTGVPLPTIKWPLLENHTKYSINITVFNHTVNSTFILAVEEQTYTSVECVSKNKDENVKEKLVVKRAEQEEQEGENMKLFRIITRLEMIVAFLVGALLSAIICCLVRKCHRNKQRSHVTLAETLEMVTSQEDPLIADGHAVENGQAIDPEASGGPSVVAADKADGDYSNLDFSRIKGKTPAKTETTETEYAEIKKEDLRQDAEGKEEEDVIEKEKEKGDEEGEGVYSNVDDLMEKSEA